MSCSDRVEADCNTRAPLSELYGRQIIFLATFGAYAAFNAGAAGSQNTETVLILRFLAGSFGSSPLTNAGGVIADMFEAEERGLAMCVFSIAPFMGPGEFAAAVSAVALLTMRSFRASRWRIPRGGCRLAMARRANGHLLWSPLDRRHSGRPRNIRPRHFAKARREADSNNWQALPKHS